MNKTNIVVDLTFGDSGKGITTDYISKFLENKVIGIRATGGPNAGHNVVAEGKQHIFSNFSSGTFRGVDTYYTEHTCFNLLNISIEKEVLSKKMEKVPLIILHPCSKVVTPYDVAYNQALETVKNHSSTGKGIASTFSRNENTGYKLIAQDLSYSSLFLEKCHQIKKYYQNLANSQGLGTLYVNKYEEFEEQWKKQVKNWKELVEIKDYSFLINYDGIVFENTQGILLDRDHGTFPHVTYSCTTSKNALEVCKHLGEDDITIWYITRCYQTRHGNGWMSNEENIKLSLPQYYNDTNPSNPHQGDWRVGELDYELLNYALKMDEIYSSNILDKRLVVTCLDQRPEFKMNYNKFETKFHSIYESYSPNCKDFKLLHKMTSS